jgi:membrane-associated protease RseP (regulator of RpoE activity)
MGYNAVQALKKAADRSAIMVVLIGSGHVAYGLGAERQARLWYDGRTASVIPVPVVGDKGEKPVVRASYANFVWGVAHEDDALYPSLGLSTPEQKTGDLYPVINVQKGSVAEAAGFKVGDLLVSMDGTPLADKETSNRLMSLKRWGDSAQYVVKRGEETLTLEAQFRRRVKDAVPPPAAP